jgi:hypothetical protein
MQVSGSGSSSQQVDTAAAELTSAGSSEQKSNASRFDEPVDLIQQLGDTLDFIDHDQSVLRSQFFGDPSGILAQAEKDRCVEQVIDLCVS